MKTTKHFTLKNLSLIILSIAALNLLACGKTVEFDTIARAPASLVEAPTDLDEVSPGEPDGPTSPSEPDGPGNNTLTEVFGQNGSNGKVDILFVVDNSPSMRKEQKKLGERLSAFLKGLDNVDWQIAFTTTDVTSSRYGVRGSIIELAGHPGQKILTNAFHDAETVFLETVKRSEVASSNEQPLKASILAMEKRNTDNAGFFRSDADLAIIVLSDENEMSRGISKKATKPQQVKDSFKTLFGTSKNLSVYGIVIQTNDEVCYADQKGAGNFQNASYGTFVTELARITNGLTGSICADDYAQTLEDIGTDVSLLSSYFLLQKTPIAGSLRVSLSPAQNIAWTLEGNKLKFATAPQEGSVIQVTYSHNP